MKIPSTILCFLLIPPIVAGELSKNDVNRMTRIGVKLDNESGIVTSTLMAFTRNKYIFFTCEEWLEDMYDSVKLEAWFTKETQGAEATGEKRPSTGEPTLKELFSCLFTPPYREGRRLQNGWKYRMEEINLGGKPFNLLRSREEPIIHMGRGGSITRKRYLWDLFPAEIWDKMTKIVNDNAAAAHKSTFIISLSVMLAVMDAEGNRYHIWNTISDDRFRFTSADWERWVRLKNEQQSPSTPESTKGKQ